MPEALLIVDHALRSHELRHEIVVALPDPMVWVEHAGRTHGWCGPFDVEILAAAGSVDEVDSFDAVGLREVEADPAIPHALEDAELARRALASLGVTAVRVPPTFPLFVADRLRAAGVTVTVDAPLYAARRRAKAEWELAGMRAAGEATQAAMAEAARLLRSAGPDGAGQLRLDGAVLRCEDVRERMARVLLDQGAESEEILVHTGDAALSGHGPGLGPVLAAKPVVIDCFPRHRASGLYYDCTRTYVPGTPSEAIRGFWADCRAALDVARAALRPGVADAHARVAEHLAAQGHAVRALGVRPETGFTHSLGHGVGLDVHEAPLLGTEPEPLAAGDTVAIEPGLYAPGVGGVRLEDTVVVTDDGPRDIVEPLSYDLEP
ncbi:MAG TPA: M24 family metallopeptidase [Solirubrobacteraceae bacterium]